VLSLIPYEIFGREIRFASLNAENNESKNIAFRSIDLNSLKLKSYMFLFQWLLFMAEYDCVNFVWKRM